MSPHESNRRLRGGMGTSTLLPSFGFSARKPDSTRIMGSATFCAPIGTCSHRSTHSSFPSGSGQKAMPPNRPEQMMRTVLGFVLRSGKRELGCGRPSSSRLYGLKGRFSGRHAIACTSTGYCTVTGSGGCGKRRVISPVFPNGMRHVAVKVQSQLGPYYKGGNPEQALQRVRTLGR